MNTAFFLIVIILYVLPLYLGYATYFPDATTSTYRIEKIFKLPETPQNLSHLHLLHKE